MFVSLRRAFIALAAVCIPFLSCVASAQSVLQPIPTSPSGNGARAVAVNPVTNRVYVVNEFDNAVSVIDGKTRAVVATVTVGSRPEYIAANPYTNRIYVSQGDASLSVIDGATNTVASYPVGATGPLAVDPYTQLVYNVRLSTAATDEVTIFDDRGATPTWRSVSTQSFQPMDITLDPLRHWYYVVHYPAGHVRQIDSTSTLDTPPSTQVDVGKPADLIAGNPITNYWYVLTENAATPIAWVDGSTDTPGGFAPSPAPGLPKALAVNTVTNKTYAAFANGVYVISGIATTPTFIASGSAAGGPAAIGINKTTNKIYVANSDGTLTIIDGDTNAASSVAIPAGATYVAVNPITNRIYVTNGAGLTEIDGATTDTVHANPLQTTITPFASNSSTADATFTFNASTGFTPSSMPIQRVYYQVDATDGRWQLATGSGPYTGTALGLGPGSHTVYAFAVDGQDAPLTGGLSEPLVGSIASYTFQVGGGTASSTSLITSKNPALVGDSITFTASVTGSKGAPTGKVDFVDGTTVLSGCSGVALSSGTAACTTTTLPMGTHSITARYLGDATYNPSTSSAISETVNPVPVDPTIALTSSANPSISNQPVTFTAAISGPNGTATGTVNFLDGGTAITGCNAVTVGATGSATCTSSTLALGTHSITAQYSGDSKYHAGTSVALSQTVNPRPGDVSMSLTSSTNPSSAGQSVTFNVTLTGASGAVTGTVTFNDGTAAITGCSAVAIASGAASCTTTALATGSHSVTAAYSGNGTYNAGTSAPVNQVVNPATVNAAIAVASSANPSTTGAPVTFTATLSGSAGTPSGTVTFNDGGSAISGCSTLALSGGKAACTTSALAAGSHAITAAYSGDTSYNAGTSPALSQAVQNAATGTNWALAANGGVASASSQLNGDYPIAAINDGERAGVNWTHGGGWADGTISSWPDWVEIDMPAAKTLSSVVVYTVQDNYASPAQPTDTMTFTQYGVTDFNVQGWDGSQWVTLGTVSGNNLVKRTVVFNPFTTSRIRVNVTGALYYVSRIVEVEAWGSGTPAVPQSNVALASTGAVASASSQLNGDYPVTAINDNDRAGANWTHGGGWADGTVSSWPDWVQIDFNGAQAIDHVVVYTVQDNYSNPVEPTDTTTFTQYGITDFQVQGWDGTQWVTLGTVSGNNLVKRTVSFTSFTTTKIRIVVTGALYYVSRITEVEAWGVPATTPPPQTNWALASNGGTASASSQLNGDYPVSAAIDGDTAGTNWTHGGGWADGTVSSWPDWLQVNFAAPKTIDHVVVFTVQDNYANPAPPTDTMTFTQYGIQDFDVQGWNGAQWVTLASVTNNNFVKRVVPFAPITTDRIRIVVNRSLYYVSRITEVQAWGN